MGYLFVSNNVFFCITNCEFSSVVFVDYGGLVVCNAFVSCLFSMRFPFMVLRFVLMSSVDMLSNVIWFSSLGVLGCVVLSCSVSTSNYIYIYIFQSYSVVFVIPVVVT